MRAGDRFKSWIEGLADSWGDRLLGWMASWVNRGINILLEALEPGLKAMSGPAIDNLKANPEVPQELKDQLDHAMGAGNILETIFIEFTIILGAFGVLLGGSQPLGRVLMYYQDRTKQSFRLDPLSVITGWRRDPEAYNQYFDDLHDQGWSDERIEALKFVTLFYPAPADLVRWQAREVFEPAMVEKYGLDDELGGITREPFYKAGMTDEQITNYWRAHWEHASWNQVVEMLHRGLMTEQDARDWFRLVEIPPFWRDKLIASSWNVPTRVDVRRFWDMRTIDEARLREIYTAQGYHGKDLDDYVLWTKIYVDFPDLVTRFKNGWLTLNQLRAELIKLGMSDERAEELIQTKVKAAASEKVAKDRDLTAAEIVKGVKKEVISWAEGLELLQDLGYDEWEAEFKLAIEVAVAAGSPESYTEFKDLTTKFRKAVGVEVKPMTEEIKKLGADLIMKGAGVDALMDAIAAEKARLVPDETIPEAATARLKELEVALHKAQAELARVQTDYKVKIAEWKQGAG